MRNLLPAALLFALAAPAGAYDLTSPETAASVLTLITGVAWLALLIVPFGPGIVELLYPRDKTALNINWNFVKDPFYFFKSFRALMQAKAYYFAKDSGTVEIQLSRPERVDVFRRLEGPEGAFYGNIVYARENSACGGGSVFGKEVYCLADLSAGRGSEFRAVGCEGALGLGPGSSVTRWAAAEGPLTAGEGSALGISAASRSRIELAPGCSFRSLFAPEIRTSGGGGYFPASPPISGAAELPPCRTEGTLVTRANVRLTAGTDLNGSVKSHGTVVLEDGVKVSGGVFAEGDIFVGRGCSVGGNLFAQGAVFVGPGARIGAPGGIKSIVAKRRVLLGGGVTVFGHVSTPGDGEVQKE